LREYFALAKILISHRPRTAASSATSANSRGRDEVVGVGCESSKCDETGEPILKIPIFRTTASGRIGRRGFRQTSS
jgi:hypothetical protein